MNLEPKVKTAIDAESPHSSPQLILVTDQRKMFLNLPDEMIVHMCHYMDSYTLLKFGRSSQKIVCTQIVKCALNKTSSMIILMANMPRFMQIINFFY